MFDIVSIAHIAPKTYVYYNYAMSDYIIVSVHSSFCYVALVNLEMKFQRENMKSRFQEWEFLIKCMDQYTYTITPFFICSS